MGPSTTAQALAGGWAEQWLHRLTIYDHNVVQRHTIVVNVAACVVDVAGGVACALLDNVCRHNIGAIRLCLTAGSVVASHRLLESVLTPRKYVRKHPGFNTVVGTDAAGARCEQSSLCLAARNGLSRS
jgi:hypothetical protein